MNILLTCRQFNGYHGTCLYFFDLATALKKLGHSVMVWSDIKGSDLHERLHRHGIEAWDFSVKPSNKKFDIILASHKDVITQFIQNNLFAPAPIISINHSELYEVEFPVIHSRIIHYIAIRGSIEQLLTGYYMIDPDDVSVIYNPINEERLLSGRKRIAADKMNIVFPGSVDLIRMQTLLSLYEKARSVNGKLTVVGQKQLDYLDKLDKDVVSVHAPAWEIRDYYANASHVGSIMMGRTEIEGWFFGLPCYEYIVNPEGEIFSVELRDPPRDMIQFTSSYVAKRIVQLCERLLRKHTQTQTTKA